MQSNISLLFATKKGTRLKVKLLDNAVDWLKYYYCIGRVDRIIVIELSERKTSDNCKQAILSYRTLLIPIKKDLMPDGTYVLKKLDETRWVIELR
ncbi:hypothetical protein [Pyrobaculum ferrireducens]|uniref:Uncharacterized protein n=1 Tax=Pyrobaculum ferrireducens TaxID=1104324 RepID=G7VF75_9CREN|nr:hypothetical protein [Pyrobaculum ferrireducens]AET31691.1 hypothetical protein P186_0230 [Pyrobaculum ferrireducens]